MSSYLTARCGLAIRATAGSRFGADDFNQVADSGVATRRFLAEFLGGEGVYAGGATELADLGGGTSYPAVKLCVVDDAGGAWFFVTDSASTITFNVAAATNGALYAVPTTIDGARPAAASGLAGGVRFVAVDANASAPSNGLLLGTGAIAGRKFTSYTAAAPKGWRVGAYAAGAPTASGYVSVSVGGATYRLLAASEG